MHQFMEKKTGDWEQYSWAQYYFRSKLVLKIAESGP